MSWEGFLWSEVGLPLCLLDSVKSQGTGNSSHCSKLCDQSWSGFGHTPAPKSLSRNSEQSLQRLLLPTWAAKKSENLQTAGKGKDFGTFVWSYSWAPDCGIHSLLHEGAMQMFPAVAGNTHTQMVSLPTEPHRGKSLMVSWANQFNELIQRSCSTESHFDANSSMEGFLSCPRPLFKPPDQSASPC